MINYSVSTSTIANADGNYVCYATPQSTGTIDIKALADHMVSHNTVYSRGTITGILTDLVTCCRELLLEGYILQIGDLGKLYVTLKSDGTITTAADFTASNITAVNVNYSAGEEFDNMVDDAEFNQVTTLETQAAVLAAVKQGATFNTETISNAITAGELGA